MEEQIFLIDDKNVPAGCIVQAKEIDGKLDMYYVLQEVKCEMSNCGRTINDDENLLCCDKCQDRMSDNEVNE